MSQYIMLFYKSNYWKGHVFRQSLSKDQAKHKNMDYLNPMKNSIDLNAEWTLTFKNNIRGN